MFDTFPSDLQSLLKDYSLNEEKSKLSLKLRKLFIIALNQFISVMGGYTILHQLGSR